LRAVSAETGAVHDGEGFRVELRDGFQLASGVLRVGDVVGERADRRRGPGGSDR
jgi:hypothetical protein